MADPLDKLHKMAQDLIEENTKLKKELVEFRRLNLSPKDLEDFIEAFKDCLDAFEGIKSSCWCKKQMRKGCWEDE